MLLTESSISMISLSLSNIFTEKAMGNEKKPFILRDCSPHNLKTLCFLLHGCYTPQLQNISPLWLLHSTFSNFHKLPKWNLIGLVIPLKFLLFGGA